MATSAIQRSAIAGQTALKHQNELVRKVGTFGGGRVTMRRTVKITPQSICDQGTKPIKKMGVEKEVLRTGKGPKLVHGQTVTVHCTGFGKNGDLSQKFWSTKDPGQKPFTFKLGQGSVIKGWDEGVLEMQLGEVARLRCTPDYAYGEDGFPAWGIQPSSVKSRIFK